MMKLLRRHHNFIYIYIGTFLFNCLYLLKWLHADSALLDPVSDALIGMALLQFIWCLFVYSMYQMLERNRAYTGIPHILAAFALGCLIQAFNYVNHVQVRHMGFSDPVYDLAEAKLSYMGLIFAVWFCFVLLVECASRRQVKKSLYSLVLSLFHLEIMCFHYVFLVFYLDNMFRFLTGWSDWEEYTRTLLWWSYTSLPYLIVSFFFAIVLVALLTVWMIGRSVGFKRDQFHRTISSDSCRRLVLYVVPDDILRVPSVSVYWLYFLFFNGNNAVLTRNLSAFRKGDDYFTCFLPYANGELREEDYEDKVCLYIRDFLFTPKPDPEREQKIMDFLHSMEQKGFHVIAYQHSYAGGDPDLRTVQKKLQNQELLYSPFLSSKDAMMRIPLDHMNQYEARRQAKTVYLKIRQLLLGSEGDPFLEDELYDLCVGSGIVMQFYTLLKMAEYCIHIRALCRLCSGSCADPGFCRKIVNPSFGTLCSLQEEPELAFQDPELAGALRWLDMLSCTKGTSQIKTRRASYGELCQVMVRLRNRFVGHGTMIYSIDEQVLTPLATAVHCLVQVFLDGPRQFPPDARILPSLLDFSIPAFLETETGPYYFSGIDQAGYISYLDFSTGRYVSTHRDRPLERVFLDVPACGDKACHAFPVLEKAVPLPDPAAEKERVRFLRRWSANPAIVCTFYSYDHIFDPMPLHLNCPYMKKSYFEHDYAEKILHRKPTPELWHAFLLEAARNIVHLFDASDWNRILNYQYQVIPFLRSYIKTKAAEGELLPGTPFKIGILGTPAHTLSNPYPWILSLEIQQFDSYEALLGWASNAYAEHSRRTLAKNTRKQGREWVLFRQRTVFYRTLLDELDCPSPLLSPNLYISGFFKNLFDYDDIETSAMAVFDFLEFTMLSVQYCLLGSQGIPPEKSLVNPDFQSMGELILAHCPADAPICEAIHQRYVEIPAHCTELQDRLTQYLPFAIKGGRMDFGSLTRILRLLRNATRGHGFIQEDNAGVLWQLLLYYALMCCKFLEIQDFRLEVSDGGVQGGYADDLTLLSDYFIVEHEVPCPLWELKKQKRQYINYFHGAYVVPDLVTPTGSPPHN